MQIAIDIPDHVYKTVIETGKFFPYRFNAVKAIKNGTPLPNKALETEPLTDTEQRIFLAAMGREEKVCKEVCDDGDGIDLVAVCHSIERKVKKALWG